MYGRTTFIGVTDAVLTFVNGQNIFCSRWENALKHIKIFETVQKSNNKIVSKETPESEYDY